MAAKDWHAEDIKAAIRKSGVTLTQLAIANGYSRTVMSMVLRTPWPAIERIIARQIKTKPEIIWPSRYHSDGSPRSSASNREHKGGRRRRHRQIEARTLT
jgi:Ner family transcriptional regulator